MGLLRDAVTGKNIHSIELAGVKAAGEGPAIKVYDLTLRNVMIADPSPAQPLLLAQPHA